MRFPTLAASAYLGYGLGIGTALFLLSAASFGYYQVQQNLSLLQEKSEIYIDLRRFFSQMQDVETGSRGYLLTGDETYIAPYSAARMAVFETLAALDAQVEDPAQRKRMGELHTLAEDKLETVANTIAIFRERGEAAAVERVRTGQGKRAMDKIRAVIDAAETRQREIIGEIKDLGRWYSTFTMVCLGAATFTIALNGAAIALAINRVSAERRRLLEETQSHLNALEASNAALNRANEELQHFSYVASHDLQEPLRSVSGYVQLLGKRYEGELDEKALGYIAKSNAAAQRMQTLIEDLLAYTRVNTQGRAFERVDTARVLDDTVANLHAAIEEAGATIRRGNLPPVEGDRVQVAQLMQNLVGNAIKFRGERPVEITIDAVREPMAPAERARWRFSIRDNGIGIAPEYLDRIFKIFQRLHTRQEYPGTGIGLALCKRIVERHEGKIWVKSTLGEGTTFYFTLPVLVPGSSLIAMKEGRD